MVFIFGLYVTPKTKVGTFTNLIEMLISAISDIKVKHTDPVNIIGGDMNKRNFSDLTQSYPDIITLNTGPTRGNSNLDLIASNIEQDNVESAIYPPLESEDGLKISCVFFLCNKQEKEG